jgi:ribosomal-protein-alanine N-acetyltransferase
MIRQVINEDIKSIYELGLKYDISFDKHYTLKDYLNNSNYLINVYEIDNKVIGFIICTKIIDTIEVQLIYIDSDYRKRGYAYKLMKSIELEGFRIILEVSIENSPAKRLYDKLGYKTISIRKEYYNGVDALVMEKVIK